MKVVIRKDSNWSFSKQAEISTIEDLKQLSETFHYNDLIINFDNDLPVITICDDFEKRKLLYT